jgi:hypothetical protein
MISYEYKSQTDDIDSRAYVYINTINNDCYLAVKELEHNTFSVSFKHQNGLSYGGRIDISAFFKNKNISFNSDNESANLGGFKDVVLPYKSKLKKQKDTIINGQKLKHLILTSKRDKKHPEYLYKAHFLINKSTKPFFDYYVYANYAYWKYELSPPIGNFQEVYYTNKKGDIIGQFTITHHPNIYKAIVINKF